MSALRCLRCGKALVRFAVSIPTNDGEVGWGPKCARAVLVQAKQRARQKATVQQASVRDPRQLDLLEAAP